MGKPGNDLYAPRPRKRLFVNPRLQGALLAHTTLYWLYCLLSVSVIAVAWIVLVKQPSTSSDLFQHLWQNFGPALIGALLLLPLVLLDCLRLSNRFAGPMVRIQRAMKQLAVGERPSKIKLRDGDFWCEFVEDLNCVIDQSLPQQCRGEVEPASAAAANSSHDQHAGLKPQLPGTQAAPVSMAGVTATNIYSDFV